MGLDQKWYLKLGKTIALVSDGGTPLISDPGYNLVQFCIENNINVTLIGKIISEKGIHFDSRLDMKNIKKFDHFS